MGRSRAPDARPALLAAGVVHIRRNRGRSSWSEAPINFPSAHYVQPLRGICQASPPESPTWHPLRHSYEFAVRCRSRITAWLLMKGQAMSGLDGIVRLSSQSRLISPPDLIIAFVSHAIGGRVLGVDINSTGGAFYQSDIATHLTQLWLYSNLLRR